ncbi:MAG TPA: BNR-repeat neuraminidase N-terminal domain-containing protein, partial [Bacteroidales bacterium]|nr:BNR-repeat neuraminidase N-terminal domain-containing protein [Bacteroidales bacterium]
MKTIVCSLSLLVLTCSLASGQTTLINETFETGTVFTMVNGYQTNLFVRNTATAQAGSYALYITNNSSGTPPPNTYTWTAASVVHAYVDVAIPSGQSDIELTFWMKGMGQPAFDRLKVFDVDPSTTITAGTSLSSGQIGLQGYVAQGEWIRCGILLASSEAGTTRRIVFSWENNASTGVDGPMALDNVTLISRVPSSMSGTYTIDNTSATSGTNFNDFVDAILRLNRNGISSSVTFNVTAGQTFYNLNPEITATGTTTKTITFQRTGTGENPVIRTGGISTSTVVTDAGISILGGDYFTFDGIDVQATANASYALVDAGFFLSPISVTDGAQYNLIKNSKITLNRTNTSSKGIYQIAGSVQSAAGANSYNKFRSIVVENAYHGVYLTGFAVYPDLEIEISNCTIGANTPNDIGNGSAAAYGIRCTAVSGANVCNNTIRNVTTTGASVYGMFLENVSGTNNVYSNNIYSVNYSGNSTANLVYGLRTDFYADGTCNVYNNRISALGHGIAAASATQVIRAMAAGVSGSSTCNIDFNSVRLDEDANPSSTALYCGGGTFNIRNNVFANYSATGATSTRYCIYCNPGTLSTSNNNDFYIATGATNNNVGFYSSADRNTLADWQTATGKDAASWNVDPMFTSTTDLHISSGSAISDLESGGAVLSGITTDMDGDVRPGPAGSVNGGATAPDIGADEFDGVPIPVQRSLSSVAYNQASTAEVPQGTAHAEILRLDLTVTGNSGTLFLNSLVVNSQNTNDGDVAAVRLYRTGTATFSTANPLGNSAVFSGGNASFSSIGYDLSTGTTYIWVTFDVAAGATLNNYLDAQIVASQLNVGGSTYPATTQSPAGNRQIKNTLTIGSGSATATWPVYRFYNYSTWECLYLQSELGSVAKDITTIAFRKSSGTNVGSITPVTIYMKHASATTLPAGEYDLSGYTQVYSGTFTNTATTGWMEMTLAEPFFYNGTDNLQILIVKGYQAAASGYPYYYATTAGTLRAR